MRAILHAFFFLLLIFCCPFLLMSWGLPSVVFAAPSPVSSAPVTSTATSEAEQEKAVWGEMPAGARTVYIGIHGGTVPVSLLTAGDGSPMIAQVGLTGTDFLYFMRRGGRLNIVPETTPASAVGEQGEVAGTPETKTNASAPALAVSGKAGSSATASGVSASDTITPGEEELPSTAPVALLPGSNATLRLARGTGSDVQVIYATGRAFELMSLVPANWAPFGLTQKPLSVEGEVKILSQPKKLPRNRRARR